MFPLYPGASGRQSFIGANNGPVAIYNFDGNPFIAAERVIYNVNGGLTSYTELMGLPDGQVGTTYWLPWYDDVNLDTQLRFGNVSNAQATVTVTIGGTPMPSFNLAVGGSDRKNYGIADGPVEITSNVPIVVAERVIYTVNNVPTSFSEMLGLPAGSLHTIYWLPWYNNAGLATDLRIGNAGNATANVTVTIGGQPVQGGSFQVGVDSAVIKTFAGVNDGPVKIQSTNAIPIVVSEGVTYKVNGVNTSFAEMMALPNGQLSSTYWLPWYNNTGLDTQLRFGNVSNSQANVQVFIGGAPVQGVTLPIGGSDRLSYVGVNKGPVRIVSNVPIIVAERIIYKVNGVPVSFSELMGLPNGQLDVLYWLPWYNNVGLDSQLRFGLP
jgi:uncharacterized protein YcfL